MNDNLELTRFVIQKVMTPPVATFGLAGNILNIAVLTRPSMRSTSTNCYLTALAIYDMLYLLLVLMMSLSHYEGVACQDFYFRVKHKFLRPITDISSNTGVWLTLTFTVERYIGVCHPIKGKIWCTAKRARYIIAGVCVMAAIITTPEFFEKEIIPNDELMDNLLPTPSLVTTSLSSPPSSPSLSAPSSARDVRYTSRGRSLRSRQSDNDTVYGFLSYSSDSKHPSRHHYHHHHFRDHYHHQKDHHHLRDHHHNRLPFDKYRLRRHVSDKDMPGSAGKYIAKPSTTSVSISNLSISMPTSSSSSPPSSSPSSSSSSSSRNCLEASRTLKAVRTHFGRSVVYRLVYLHGNQVLFTFLPLFLLMIFNHLLLRQVIRASRERRKMAPSFSTRDYGQSRTNQLMNKRSSAFRLDDMSSNRLNPCQRSNHQVKDQQRITIMLITLVIVFILCQLPQSLQNIYRVYRSFSSPLTKETINVMLITGNIFNFLVVVNCSSNFILYSLISTRFRNTFTRICCG